MSKPITIQEAWERIETALQEATSRHGISIPPQSSATFLITELERKGKIDSQYVALFHDIRAFKEGNIK